VLESAGWWRSKFLGAGPARAGQSPTWARRPLFLRGPGRAGAALFYPACALGSETALPLPTPGAGKFVLFRIRAPLRPNNAKRHHKKKKNKKITILTASRPLASAVAESIHQAEMCSRSPWQFSNSSIERHRKPSFLEVPRALPPGGRRNDPLPQSRCSRSRRATIFGQFQCRGFTFFRPLGAQPANRS